MTVITSLAFREREEPETTNAEAAATAETEAVGGGEEEVVVVGSEVEQATADMKPAEEKARKERMTEGKGEEKKKSNMQSDSLK